MKRNLNDRKRVIMILFGVGLISILVGCAGAREVDPETRPVDGQAYRVKEAFSMEYSVATKINAEPSKIWALLIDAPEYPNWNSTIVSVEGEIALGKKIVLISEVDPDREFNLEITEFSPGQKLVWGEGTPGIFNGVRTFTLSRQEDGSTVFIMVEVLSGMMLPMIEGSIPDLRPSFKQFASDLKVEAGS